MLILCMYFNNSTY